MVVADRLSNSITGTAPISGFSFSSTYLSSSSLVQVLSRKSIVRKKKILFFMLMIFKVYHSMLTHLYFILPQRRKGRKE
jgi:hypothetical protein